MKKNITINLFGRLYPIDEDAYQVLLKYEESLRNYFSKQEGGGEIVNDIEARIAELFDEARAEGHDIITIEDVQNIIVRIGNPKQMEEEGSSESIESRNEETEVKSETAGTNNEEPQHGASNSQNEGYAKSESTTNVKRKKMFFRDGKDQKLCGVLSGCAAYFGGTAFAWRICFVALFFFGWILSGLMLPGFLFMDQIFSDGYVSITNHTVPSLQFWLILAYFLVALIAPKSRTTEDQMRMKGIEVTPENIAKEVAEESKKATSQQNNGCANGCLSALVLFFKLIAGMLLFAFAIIVLLSVLGLVALLTIPIDGEFADMYKESLIDTLILGNTNSITIAICLLIILIVPIYCLIHSILVNKEKAKRMGRWQRIFWTALWLVAGITMLFSANNLMDDLSNIEIATTENQYNDSLNDGTWLTPEDSTFLADGGWTLVKREACHKQGYTRTGEYYTGDESVRYIDVFNEYGKQIFRAERTETDLENGTYTLTAVARAWGTGAFIYAIADSVIYMKEIPQHGFAQGEIWENACDFINNAGSTRIKVIGNKQLSQLEEQILKDDELARKIASAHDNNGYGWSVVTITDIQSKSGKISYGVTNDPELTDVTFQGEWFSATDFELTKK